jgi:hypothetical protein
LTNVADNLAERRTPSEVAEDLAVGIGEKVLAVKDRATYTAIVPKETLNRGKESTKAYLSQKRQAALDFKANRSADRQWRKLDLQRARTDSRAAFNRAAALRKAQRQQRKVDRRERKAGRQDARAGMSKREIAHSFLSEGKKAVLGRIAVTAPDREGREIDLQGARDDSTLFYAATQSYRNRLSESPTEVMPAVSIGRKQDRQQRKESVQKAKEQAASIARAAAQARKASRIERQGERMADKRVANRAHMVRRRQIKATQDKLKAEHKETSQTRKATAQRRKIERLNKRKVTKLSNRSERDSRKQQEYAKKLASHEQERHNIQEP